MEIKYTNDGKKVVVIGNLNAQEKIVQEIFIVNGNEVPSGENFVVKSLHDAPAVSWQEANAKKVKEQLEREEKQLKETRERLSKLEREEYAMMSEKIKYLKATNKALDFSAFETAFDLLSGNINYVVFDHYSPKLYTMEEFENEVMSNKEYGRFESFKLISLYGGSKGNLQYKISSCSDGSGGRSIVFFFKDREPAIKKLQEIIEEDDYYDERKIKMLKKYELPINKEKLEKYKENMLKNELDRIRDHEATIAKAKQAISEIEAL